MNRKGPWEGYSRLARCLLPAFLWAHIFIKRETSGYEAVTPKSGTEPIWYVTLHFSRLARRSFASLLKSCPNHLYVWTEARTSAGVPDKAIRHSVLNIAQSLNPRSLAKRVVNLNWTKSALIIYKKSSVHLFASDYLEPNYKRGKSEHRWNFIP